VFFSFSLQLRIRGEVAPLRGGHAAVGRRRSGASLFWPTSFFLVFRKSRDTLNGKKNLTIGLVHAQTTVSLHQVLHLSFTLFPLSLSLHATLRVCLHEPSLRRCLNSEKEEGFLKKRRSFLLFLIVEDPFCWNCLLLDKE
jgi:hypothetical protein